MYIGAFTFDIKMLQKLRGELRDMVLVGKRNYREPIAELCMQQKIVLENRWYKK